MDKPEQISKKKLKNQQKSKPQTMKNVLLTPYKRSWPILPPQYQQEFEHIFYSNLSLLVPLNQPKIPWSALKDIPKEQRRNIRQKFKKPIEIDNSLRKSLIFGVNECTKALEKHETVAIFISSNCNPEMMVNHIVRMAEARKIAVWVIPSLKESVKRLIGFPCVCLGIRKLENLANFKAAVEFAYKIKDMRVQDIVIEKTDSLSLITDSIVRVVEETNIIELSSDSESANPSQDTPKIVNITIADSPGTNLDATVQIIDDPQLICLENSTVSKETHENLNKIINLEAEPDLHSKVQIIDDSSTEITLDKNTEPDLVIATKEIDELGPYLYRTSTNQRAFVPPRSDGFEKNLKTFQPAEDFIPFTGNCDQYIPLVIKRLKGSNKRKKKKTKNNQQIKKTG